MDTVISLKNISKKFANTLANDNVSIDIHKGEVLCILGENGAGKSTIMKILYGLYKPTSGEIFIDGKKVEINSPKDAFAHGISMIQQHFSLINAETVTENIILGNVKGVIDYKKANDKVAALSKKYNFNVPPESLIKDLPVGVQQKVEILKALNRDTRILIMDEPTAVLVPQEIDTLMDFIKSFTKNGNSVVFITHKMKEVMRVADRIVIMRDGIVTGIVNRSEVSTDDLAQLMIGHKLEALEKEMILTNDFPTILEVKGLTVSEANKDILANISFDIHKGEIFAIAGVSGNGQEELCEAIYGARKVSKGSIKLNNIDITNKKVKDVIALGVGYQAADRYRYAMVKNMSLTENMFLKSSYLPNWVNKGLIKWQELAEYTQKTIKNYSIKASSEKENIGALSGGNQQKVIVAREIDMGKEFSIFDQPTRGLDLGAINYVHKTILSERKNGKGILLVSTELSEIFALADRIAVMFKGEFMGIFLPNELDTKKIGLLMAGIKEGDKNE